MVYNNKVQPISDLSGSWADNTSHEALSGIGAKSVNSTTPSADLDAVSTIHLEESSYLKLKPFSRLDPTLVRLLRFLSCFGLAMNSEPKIGNSAIICEAEDCDKHNGERVGRRTFKYLRFLKVTITLFVALITSEVVYDVNLRQSKLLAEQKRSTPLLTFVIVAYSWLTLIIPLTCDISLIFIGPYLFRFYSRTTATVCNGMYFGKKTSVDTWYYYLGLVLIAFLDVIGQVVLLGVWPPSIDPYMRMIVSQNTKTFSAVVGSPALDYDSTPFDLNNQTELNKNRESFSSSLNNSLAGSSDLNNNSSVARYSNVNNSSFAVTSLSGLHQNNNHDQQQSADFTPSAPRITTYLLDFILGETHAHGDLGVCVKIVCLMVQFMHSYAFLIIIISLADHYATAINNINDNLDKFEFRRLLKQLIILRDSSEQISLMISIPFSLIIMLVFMRQIALNGVFIQSTMLPYENWAVSLQSFTCSVSIFMVFIYCDGLQSASKQTHRLKTEQTVINENRGGNQSIYEFLDYLDRLSKSIRITFFNIIAINKSSLVGLFGHVLTLTFVTS